MIIHCQLPIVNYLSILFGVFVLFLGNDITAQNRALAQPKSFDRPIDNNSGFGLLEEKERIKAPWIVICDRNNAQTFKDSKGKPSQTEFKKLKFKDWFYVSDEKDGWIRIFKGQVSHSNLKVAGASEDYGWIEKTNILQWKSGLIDSKTQIHLKAFLLNKANDIKNVLNLEKKEIVPIYKGPKVGETIEEKTIYEFYFVFKKENDRYLIAKNVNINPQLNIDDLVGWVRKNRLEDWNTRICLEPNFKEEAFEERQQNEQFQFVAYHAETGARTHATEGKIEPQKIIWENDPVHLDKNQLAKEGKRFKGAVVRFPMLSSHRVNSSFYRSGVIGDINVKMFGQVLESINEINYSGILRDINNHENSRNNFNILFVVEGTQGMSKYKNALSKALTSIQSNLSGIPSVKYGAAIYRDTPEKPHDKLFEIKPLTSNMEEVVGFINQSQFRRWADNDEYTAMRYGINQAMLEAGLNDNHTNIVILVGNDADFYANRIRKISAQSSEEPTCLETEIVAEKLAKLNVHFIALQCQHNSDRESVYYVKQVRDLMVEAAKQQHDLYKGVTDYVKKIKLINPKMPEDEALTKQVLEGGPAVGMLKRPPSGASLSDEELSNFMSEAVRQVQEFVEEFWRQISQLANEGSSIDEISAGEFAPAAAKMLMSLLEKGNNVSWTRDDIVKLTGDKYKLYTEVFIPKHIKNAKYPTASQVLFMPQSDLESYIRTLDRLGFAMTKPTDELRDELYSSLRDLMKQYTGNEFLKNASTEDLRASMQGIAKEGLQTDNQGDYFLIEDVKSSKKVSDEQVRKFAHRMAEKTGKLKRILHLGKKYEFSYVSKDNLYFWIPIDMTF